MRLRLDNDQRISFDPQRHPHLDHGYAVTSYSSQGQTADRVLINVDTELRAKDLLNNRMAYVSVSRGQSDAQIFTNDRSALANALGHDDSHQSALRSEQVVAPVQTPNQGEMHEQANDLSMGMGLGI
jgi:ATP-dependent exoDNAse (exonuclease V) alpha subunit